MTATRQFRQLLAQPGLVVAPGAYDALSARAVAAAGFPALYLGSFATAAGLLGMPDAGLITQTELVDAARRITAVVDIPVIADGENGFGNALNARRTVRAFEQAGVAAIHLEDCAVPKHVGHIPDRVIAREEMVQKLRAALDARRDPDFAIIARTDAKAANGLADAVERAQSYLAEGADLAFIVGLRPEETAAVVAQLKGPLFNVNAFTPVADLEAAGQKVAIYPLLALQAALQGVTAVLEELRRTGAVVETRGRLAERDLVTDLIGMGEVDQLVRRYALIPDGGG